MPRNISHNPKSQHLLIAAFHAILREGQNLLSTKMHQFALFLFRVLWKKHCCWIFDQFQPPRAALNQDHHHNLSSSHQLATASLPLPFSSWPLSRSHAFVFTRPAHLVFSLCVHLACAQSHCYHINATIQKQLSATLKTYINQRNQWLLNWVHCLGHFCIVNYGVNNE